ncbi:AAA family ATPase [Microtetraspora niveoalba]|uniref:AAA family ATPase n=1 Tax=Microtetraspora niveoalba TaxID=46175 RepID=UPI0008327B34|nr:LuxR family transcriptional regulator [Microtetraspora niveoalba]
MRARELAAVAELLDRAGTGERATLLIDGEPGAGKTTLLARAAERAAARGFGLAAGGAEELDRLIPLNPLLSAFDDIPAEGDPAPESMEARVERLRIHMEKRMAAGPLLVTLDDLHWADPATLMAVRTLHCRLPSRPLAWMLTRTTGGRDRAAERLFDLLERHGARRLALGPLPDDAVARVVAELLRARPDPGLLAFASGAGGNPFLLVELVDGLRDEGAIEIAGGRARLVSPVLPRRVHVLARHRLDRLSREARHLVEAATVLGRTFSPGDVAELLGASPAMLLPALEEALEAGLLAATGDALTFRHELVWRAVLAGLPRPLRLALRHQAERLPEPNGESERAPGADATDRTGAAAGGPGRVPVTRLNASLASAVRVAAALRRGDLRAALSGAPADRSRRRPPVRARPAADDVIRAMTAGRVIEAGEGAGPAMDHLVREDVYSALARHPWVLAVEPACAAWLVRLALRTGDRERAELVRTALDRLPGDGPAGAGQAGDEPGGPGDDDAGHAGDDRTEEGRDRAGRTGDEWGRHGDGDAGQEGDGRAAALSAAAAHARGLLDHDPRALALAAERAADPWSRASAAEDLGLLLCRTGERVAGIESLNRALAGYEEAAAPRDAARLRRRLRQEGVRRRHWSYADRPVTGWDSLTDTEHTVSLLVAQGWTNRQVAEQMFISVHTVAFHLRQIFRKLDIRSRVELTRLAVEHTAGPRPVSH